MLLVCPLAARALAPHEVLVLSNRRSVDSVQIAKEFMKLRQVPQVNHVRLDLPPSVTRSPGTIKHADFTRLIWSPAMRAMRAGGIEDQILAWVYSVDFPVRIEAKPSVSIQGLTFLRNRMPEYDDVRYGMYASPLFAGPNNRRGIPHYSQTFDVYRKWLKDEMPLPSMMLGYTGERGNTPETVTACLRRGAVSDGAAPKGTVYFVRSKDIRSTCRQWQYPAAVGELRAMGIKAVITERFPAGRNDIIGLFMGSASAHPEKASYLPGSMAEHFTSAAAVFHTGHQTKLSAWLKAGVTASAGTVTEPYSIWSKIPSARFFVHYGAGCTMIESYFQSIRCPLQILLVGDPLAAPWAPQAGMKLLGPADGKSVSGTVRINAAVASAELSHYGEFAYLLDGRAFRSGCTLDLDTRELKNGPHRLRAVAYRTGFVRNPVFAEVEITVTNAPDSGASE